MMLLMIVRVAFRALMANKLRSVLAMLGIIIGVGAVIAMLALGAGAKQSVVDSITAMGSNLLVVRPGLRGNGGVITGSMKNLTVEDAQEILKSIPHIRQVSPLVSGPVQLKHLNMNENASCMGVATTYMPLRNFELGRGRMISDA